MSNKTILCRQCNTRLPKSLEVTAFNFCPKCCALLPKTKKFVNEYFDRIGLDKKLYEAKRLFVKNEYAAAARVATILLEREIKNLINDDRYQGVDLMTKAFSFVFDEKNKRLEREPLIKLNSLETKSERNEQEGMKFLCMGLMKGARNVLAHATGHVLPFKCLSLISSIDFILKEITHDSSLAQDLNP